MCMLVPMCFSQMFTRAGIILCWMATLAVANLVPFEPREVPPIYRAEIRRNGTVLDTFEFRMPYVVFRDDFHRLHHPRLWPHVLTAHFNATMDPKLGETLINWLIANVKNPPPHSAEVQFGKDYSLYFYRSYDEAIAELIGYLFTAVFFLLTIPFTLFFSFLIWFSTTALFYILIAGATAAGLVTWFDQPRLLLLRLLQNRAPAETKKD